jgi:hypothetical protein
VDITTSDTTTPSIEEHEAIMRSRAQRLNHQVKSFFYLSAFDLEEGFLPSDLIILWSQGMDHGGQVGHQEAMEEPMEHAQQGEEPIQFRVTKSDFESNSESRTTSS